MSSTFSPSSRAAIEHKKSLDDHNAHASTKSFEPFTLAENAVAPKPTLNKAFIFGSEFDYSFTY